MKILCKNIKIKYSYVKFASYIFAMLPLLFFFSGWFKWYFYIIAIAATSMCFYATFRKNEEKEEHLDIKLYALILLVLLAFAYSFFCGIGRLWAQSKDYPWRNAIFRDLILKDWPVMYDSYDGALVYYIGLWLPAAFIGKVFHYAGLNDEASFTVGNIALLIYITIGLTLLFLLLAFYFNARSQKIVFLGALMFIFFSGMDILGSIEPLGANNYHLEWWASKYQYSSFTTCMCWVFNQSVIPWIVTLILVKDRKIEDFVFLGMMCLMSGPFPFVGFFIYCVLFGLYELVLSVKNKQIKDLFIKVFSLSNILAALAVFPFIGLYYLSNASISGSGSIRVANVVTESVSSSGSGSLLSSGAMTYICFCLVEFLFFGLMILRKYYKDYLYYCTIAMLFVFPFIKMGHSSDFSMRASIPTLFVLFLLCGKFVFDEKKDSFEKLSDNINDIKANKKEYNMCQLKKYTYILLVLGLCLGTFTPAVEFIRGFRQVSLRGIDDVVTDYIKTLDGSGGIAEDYEYTGYEYGNFVSVNKENTVFFKYICK